MRYNRVRLRKGAWLLNAVVWTASSWGCIPGELDLEPEAADAARDSGSAEAAKPDAGKTDARTDASADAARDTVALPEAPSNDRSEDDVASEAEGSIGMSEAGDVAHDTSDARRDVGPDAPCSGSCCPSCVGKTCGASDGCGGLCDGPCSPPETCGGGGVAHHGLCSDGYCPPPDTCGGGGTPNQCGCMPNCVDKGCGQKDGCHGVCSDGRCPVQGQTCGGGGVPNECGSPGECTSGQMRTSACGNCGTQTDNCVSNHWVAGNCDSQGVCAPMDKATCATGCQVGAQCVCAAMTIQRTCTNSCAFGSCEFPSPCHTCGDVACTP
jgi:hypothetical protein